MMLKSCSLRSGVEAQLNVIVKISGGSKLPVLKYYQQHGIFPNKMHAKVSLLHNGHQIIFSFKNKIEFPNNVTLTHKN